MIWDHALWHWTSLAWLVALVWVALYLIVFRRAAVHGLRSLVLGASLMVLAFVSPIGVLADGYLFSAHMVQHLLLLLVIPMCLLLSLPKEKMAQWFENARLDRAGRMLSHPVPGWVCGVGAMWLWHVPVLCSAATQNAGIGCLRDTSFLLAGLAFWWPIFAPVQRYRLPPLSGISYLFSACIGCTLLGIYITFTTITVCPAFANPVDRLHVLTSLYDAGLTPAIDQQLGGLLMWVPPCSLYVGVIISLLCRWYSNTETVTPPESPGGYGRPFSTSAK
ncbi:cytochrome c oxidase assembly protein [Aeoliella sp. ICT_H6.2]|uniref:Cytochrome c oxidase assembly protein n=1 Tax=Aeoliella straminimaris TaxID=2954799 RepID=A0A9X2F8J1_9BACT|nr:cytochrome c oxidase assembly protein [Aeoliella straminimaris]MCO6044327.1 cytochrome c oxidase assembly protein [Aeoliella straminimaris]